MVMRMIMIPITIKSVNGDENDNDKKYHNEDNIDNDKGHR